MTGAAIHAVMASACLVAIHLLLSCSDGGRGGFCPGTPVSEGDIALRRGRGLASRVVIGADPMGKYSHIGIVARAGDGMVVVHSVPGESDDGGPDRVKAEPLQSFFSPGRAAAGALMHFRGDTAVAGRASRIALELARRGVDDEPGGLVLPTAEDFERAGSPENLTGGNINGRTEQTDAVSGRDKGRLGSGRPGGQAGQLQGGGQGRRGHQHAGDRPHRGDPRRQAAL